MKFALTCPRKEWVKGNPNSAAAVQRLADLGLYDPGKGNSRCDSAAGGRSGDRRINDD